MDFCDTHTSVTFSRKGQGCCPNYINPEKIVLMDMLPLKIKCVGILLHGNFNGIRLGRPKEAYGNMELRK